MTDSDRCRKGASAGAHRVVAFKLYLECEQLDLVRDSTSFLADDPQNVVNRVFSLN